MAFEKQVTIAIINYNGEHALAETLSAIQAQDYPHLKDVWVIDNLSTDNSVAMLNSDFPDTVLIESKENRGPNPARNYALEHAVTDFILIMDNDIAMEPDAVSLLVEAFDQHPEAGAVSAQIRFADDKSVIQYNGANIHYAGEAIVNTSDSDVPVKVGALSAGCVMVDREKALQTGRFDEDFFFGWEDGDFFYRMAMAGFPCFVQSRARVYHKKAKRGIRHVNYQVRNRWWFMLKNYNTRTFIVALPMILVYQLSVFLFLILKGHGLDYCRGFFSVFRGLQHIQEKHRMINSVRKLQDKELLIGSNFNLITDVAGSVLMKTANHILSALFTVYWRLFRRIMN